MLSEFYKETKFKETEIGRIPKGWNVCKIEDIAKDFVSGGTPSTKEPNYWNGNIPWIRSVHLTNYYIDNSSVQQYITKEGLENSAAKIVPRGNIIIATRVGIGKSAVNLLDVAINQDLTGILIDKTKIDPFYLVWYLNSSRVIKLLNSFSRGTTIKGITKSSLKNLVVPLPPLQEQKKIAEILSTIDEAIQTVDESIKQAERLKKALMQELLTKGIGHREFKETEIGRIPKEWKVIRLGNLGTLKDGDWILKKYYDDRGEVRLIQVGDIGIGKFLDKSNRYISAKAAKELRVTYVKPNKHILISRMPDPIGRACIAPELPYPYIVAVDITMLEVDESIADRRFIMWYLNSNFNFNQVKQFSSGATRNRISRKNLEKIKVLLPPLEEQKKIAEILSTIDEVIQLKREKKRKLERMKKQVIHLLLTGKVRVKV